MWGGASTEIGNLAYSLISDYEDETYKPKILDMGSGLGFFGFYLYKAYVMELMEGEDEDVIYLDKFPYYLKGVEIHEKLAADAPLYKSLYNKVENLSLVDYYKVHKNEKVFITLLLDVLEHLDTIGDVKFVVNSAIATSKYVILSIPSYFYSSEYLDSAYEKHNLHLQISIFLSMGFSIYQAKEGTQILIYSAK